MSVESLVKDSETLKRAKRRVEELGLPQHEALDKEKEVRWPRNVADLSQEDLGEHMTWWSGWAAYARQNLAEVETNLAAIQKKRDLAEGKYLIKMKGDYPTVTETKARIAEMDDVLMLDAQLMEAEGLRRMVKAVLSGYEDKYATVSREISRRNRESVESDRSHNVGHWPRGK